ncbi:MAG TPA: FCD domain-containing protein [Chthoniobacterales bacterium]|jgi:DNA-binding FadR family transcriptional regulator
MSVTELSAEPPKPTQVDRVCHELSLMTAPNEHGVFLLPPEHELTSRFKVSRTVLREATKRLESLGLLQSRHGVGVEVVRKLHKPVASSLRILVPDPASRLSQTMDTRFLLEVEMARQAAANVTPEAVKELGEMQTKLERAKSSEEAVALDIVFHQMIVKTAGNMVVGLMLDALSELIVEVRRLTISRTGILYAARQHAGILEAIAAGNGEHAAAAMHAHLVHAREDLLAQLAELPVE